MGGDVDVSGQMNLDFRIIYITGNNLSAIYFPAYKPISFGGVRPYGHGIIRVILSVPVGFGKIRGDGIQFDAALLVRNRR